MPSKNHDPEKRFQSYMIVNRSSQIRLLFLGFLFFVGIFFVIHREMVMQEDKNWLDTVPSILFLGIFLIIYPLTEAWIYKPWQTRARKYEESRYER